MSMYYSDEFVTLYHGDCRAERLWETAQVLVTDPPYGTQFSADNPLGGYGRRQDVAPEGFTIANDATTDLRDEALNAWGDRPALVFGSPRLPDPPGRWDDRLVWDKRRPGMNGGAWRYTHESIYVRGFVRASTESYSVLVSVPERPARHHMHAKPVALMETLLASAPPGVIADPFAGSGSTLIAARNLGRKIIGVELEERYCAVIVDRLSQQAFDFSGLT